MRRRRYYPTTTRGAQLRLLLAVLRRLTADWWSVDELATDIGASRRTVWRALAPLRAEGLPLERVLETRVSYYRLAQRWWEPEASRMPTRKRTRHRS